MSYSSWCQRAWKEAVTRLGVEWWELISCRELAKGEEEVIIYEYKEWWSIYRLAERL